MASPVRGLAKTRSLLKEDGVVVVAVPNANYLLIKSRLLCNPLGRVIGRRLGMECSGCWSPEQHQVNYSPRTLTRILERSGFQSRLVVNEEMISTGLTRDHFLRLFLFLSRLIYALTFSRVNVNVSFVAFAGKLSH